MTRGWTPTRGWVLDARPDEDRDLMDVWILEESGRRSRLSHPYRPYFVVGGERGSLRELMGLLEGYEEVRSLELTERMLDVHHTSPVWALKVGISCYRSMREMARTVERLGGYREFSLYDVDLRLPTRYFMENGIFPLAHVRVTDRYELLDDPDWGVDPLPPLRAAFIDAVPRRTGLLPRFTDRIGGVRLGDWSLEGEDEGTLIRELVGEIARQDPDLLVTSGGDSFMIPYLYGRAVENSVEEELVLDRSGRPFRAPEREGRSYFSYGRMFFKPAYHPMSGRLHLDGEGSFILREGKMVGLAVLSRMSLLPLQDMSRLSPGSAISYMECVEAMRRGFEVRWKKNLPEEWKTAVELSRSDRGGHIFDPLVGAYSDVVEMDFSSFYPHIMWRKNLSVETLNCGCCAGGGGIRVPGLSYHVCTRREGLISHVVGRILEARMRYKRLSREMEASEPYGEEAALGPVAPPGGSARCYLASNILKWVLVTSFGYTGYKNARFGRIEAHESITAFAREMMLRAKEVAERGGFTVLHGIVDSLWLRGPIERAEEIADAVGGEMGIPMSVDARYRWIIFLPNRSNGAGALTRYFGLRDDGTLKMRGIETRQHSTPPYIKMVQEEAIMSLAGAASAEEIPDHLPLAAEVLRRRGAELMERSVDPRDLVLTIRVSRDLHEYSTFSEHVAALTLLRREGIRVRAGEKVRFVVTDHSSGRAENRVRLLTEEMGEVRYDVGRYLELTARAVGGSLSLFGLGEEEALGILKGVEQKRLDEFP